MKWRQFAWTSEHERKKRPNKKVRNMKQQKKWSNEICSNGFSSKTNNQKYVRTNLVKKIITEKVFKMNSVQKWATKTCLNG